MILNDLLVRGRRLLIAAALAWFPVLPAAAQTETAQTPSDVDALLKAGSPERAVEAYDGQVDRTGKSDPQVLLRLATSVLQDVFKQQDASARVEACLTLLKVGEHPCVVTLRSAAKAASSPGVRLRAAAATAPRGEQSEAIGRVLANVEGAEWAAVVDAAPAMLPETRVVVLGRALQQAPVDVRYSALKALSTSDSPAAIRILRQWSKRSDTPGHLLALAAVARAGDEEALASIRKLLPDLHGEDLLAAGVALATQGDPQGLEGIRAVLNGPDELLKLEAAAALARLGHADGRERLEADLNSSDVWVRLRTLEQLEGLIDQPSRRVWRLMADPLLWVRLRAAERTIEGVIASVPGLALQQ